jgi:hypothetical protein
MKNLLHSTCWATMLCATVVSAKANSVVLPPDRNYTILHAAAKRCDVEKTREALKALPRSSKNEQINLLDREGYTPLGYAARAGCLEVVKLLLKAGASVDVAEARGGWTPLLRSADQRHSEVVRYLLDHGANPTIKTLLGKTPLSVALAGSVFSFGPEGDRNATVNALLEKRADASPLLAAYDELVRVAHEQRQQIAALQAERQRLEAECRRLNDLIEKIRSAAGDLGYRPN